MGSSNSCEKNCDSDVQARKDLWMSGRFSDFNFFIGSEKFELHKVVLGTQSSLFEEIFENEMKGIHEMELKIENAKTKAVAEFLRFFYTGEDSSDENLIEVLELAFKFDVQKLRLKCEQSILKIINDANAFRVFTVGRLVDSTTLKEKAFDQIKGMFPDLELEKDMVD